MKKKLAVAAFAVLLAPAALAQGLEPGEWEFTTTMNVPGMPQPQTHVTRQCIKKNDKSSAPWEKGAPPKSDCKVSSTKKSGDTTSWEMSCPSSNMRGRGTARITRDSMESEMTMSGAHQGQSFEMHTKTRAKRLGPCK